MFHFAFSWVWVLRKILKDCVMGINWEEAIGCLTSLLLKFRTTPILDLPHHFYLDYTSLKFVTVSCTGVTRYKNLPTDRHTDICQYTLSAITTI